jgi:predicted nucleic acid-binding protein
MRRLFADTSYWFALLVRSDPWHDIAMLLSLEISGARIFTTEMVLAELLNGVSRLGEYHRNLATTELMRMRSNANVEIIAQTELQFRNAFNLFQSRPDQRWGLTDCASFIAMRERGITHALTADRDFTHLM